MWRVHLTLAKCIPELPCNRSPWLITNSSASDGMTSRFIYIFILMMDVMKTNWTFQISLKRLPGQYGCLVIGSAHQRTQDYPLCLPSILQELAEAEFGKGMPLSFSRFEFQIIVRCFDWYILKDVPFSHLTAILDFMYAGEVTKHVAL